MNQPNKEDQVEVDMNDNTEMDGELQPPTLDQREVIGADVETPATNPILVMPTTPVAPGWHGAKQ